jgi:hypothetical protein
VGSGSGSVGAAVGAQVGLQLGSGSASVGAAVGAQVGVPEGQMGGMKSMAAFLRRIVKGVGSSRCSAFTLQHCVAVTTMRRNAANLGILKVTQELVYLVGLVELEELIVLAPAQKLPLVDAPDSSVVSATSDAS